MEGDVDKRGTGFSASGPLPPSIVDQKTHTLVARARNIQLCGTIPASAVRLRDRKRAVVEPHDGLEEVPIEAWRSGA